MIALDWSRSETRRRFLGLLFARPGEEFYQRDLERRLGMSIGAIQHEIRNLEAEGVIKRRRLGNLVLFSLDTSHPLHAEIASAVAKTIGILPALRQALKNIAGIRVAFLYGSYVSTFSKPRDPRAWSAQSDVDVMIVGKAHPRDLASLLREIGRHCGREVNTTLLAADEFRAKIAARDSFLLEVLSKPLLPLAGFPGLDDPSPVRMTPRNILKRIPPQP